MGRTRIDQLSDAERARFDEWADRWIDIGLRTGQADRARFEVAVRDCYRFAGIPFPEVVVWVASPMVMAIAAPAAAFTIELLEASRRHPELFGGRGGSVGGAVDDAVRGAVRGAVDGAVGGAVDGAVDGAVGGAVGGADAERVRVGALQAIQGGYYRYVGGQLWVGGWWYGGAWTSFFREVCELELQGDLWDRARAYESTMESACWWWPHRRFVMVCERPQEIHRELVNPAQPRGFGSHRLHNDTGPAVVWPDGWGVWAVHGTRVPQEVVEAPHTLSPERILKERNAEVRRVMIDRFGAERLMRESNATKVSADEYGTLWRLELADDEPIVMVQCTNSTAEPDGSFKDYWLRVPPRFRTAQGAIAWTFGEEKRNYKPLVQT